MSKELKILINNEEVVCDKQISIDEKMLSTSSTILKNCYPKFWETDKDYVSRFYFPKDYSKCRISYDEFHPEEQGEIVTGTNLSINYDSTKNFELLQLQGNTYQQTYTGKNLLKNTSTNSGDNNYWSQYSTYDQTTGTLTRSTSGTTEQFIRHQYNLKNNTKYTVSCLAKSNGYVTNFEILAYNSTASKVYGSGRLNLTQNFQKYYLTFTTDSSTNFTNANIRFDNNGSTTSGTTATLTIKDVMLVEGEDTNFEPYVGGTASPNPDYPQPIQNVTGRQTIDVVGKNLFDKSVTPSSQNGTTTTELDTGIRAKVTATGQNKYTAINLKNPSNLLGKTLTISATITPSGTNNALIRVYWLNGNTLTGLISNTISTTGSYTFTIPSSFPTNKNGIALVFSSNASSGTSQVEDYVDYTNVQLEIGSTATTYEEYKGQSYEINLGKNLFKTLDTPSYLNLATYSKIDDNSFTLTYNQTSSSSSSPFVRIDFDTTVFKPNTTYTVSKKQTISGISMSGVGAIRKYVNGSYGPVENADRITFTTPNVITSIGITLYLGYNNTTIGESTITFYDIQIEEGDTQSDFSPYFTPIELNKIGNYQDSIKKSTGKNLFDKSTIIEGKYIDGSGNFANDSNNFIGALTRIDNIKTYYVNASTGSAKRIAYYDSTQTFISRQLISTYGGTLTIPNNAKYVRLSCYNVDLDTLQLEQNSQATPYEPYLPIGTWYIEKNIGKAIIDGTSGTFSNPSANRFNIDDLITDFKKIDISNLSFSNYYKSYYQVGTNGQFNELVENVNYGFDFSSSLLSNTLRFKNTDITSVNDFKTWLSTHNTIVYYVLSTPTYTEITNEELINQLESIELLNGINNITVTSPNVPGALKIHYNFKEAYTESDLVFCGVVKNTGNISLNPREPHYVDLQILDFKCLLSEGETLNYVINDKTIPEAIEQVVTSISDYGFVIGNINILNPNDKINAYSTLNKTAYDVFQYIADVTQSKWATRVIDEDTIAIDFYDPTLMPQASPIEYNQTYFENNDIENMTFNYSTNDYRNKQIMTSDEVFGNIEQIETIISNGYQDTYTCQNKIGIIKKITVNDVECTFATKNEVELGVTADFIYQPGEIVFTSSQIYTSGSVIVITYLPIVKGREIVLNNEESSRISSQINRKGTISRYENRNDTTSGQELIKIGQSYIKYKGSAEITLKIVSSKNLFNVGQIVEFNAPLEELSTEYMVKNKTIDIWTIDSNETQVFYTYELSSNFNSENAINYFDNQRAKNQGNIGEGETIVRNIDIENTALIQFYETNIEEVEISNISTLDFSLDAVLI